MFKRSDIMKAKKIIERVFKFLNILANLMMGLVAFTNACNYGTQGYMYSDTYQRIIWIVVMAAVVNIADYFIRKVIRDF